jgi:Mg2+ and Co2+ transporter CorA
MNEPHSAPPSGWTIDTYAQFAKQVEQERDLRYEQRFRAQQEALSYALNAAKEAVAKAETATEKRFDAVNEFRSALSDAAARMMPRAESESAHKAIVSQFDTTMRALSDRIDTATVNMQRLSESNSNRIIAIESVTKGSANSFSSMIAVAAVLLAVLSAVLGVYAASRSSGSPPAVVVSARPSPATEDNTARLDLLEKRLKAP